MLYLFIDENTIQPYNGENLKRYVGNKLVKTIANPTEADLREFMYMSLVEETEPEYDLETQCLKHTYNVENGIIYETYEVKNISIEDESDIEI